MFFLKLFLKNTCLEINLRLPAPIVITLIADLFLLCLLFKLVSFVFGNQPSTPTRLIEA